MELGFLPDPHNKSWNIFSIWLTTPIDRGNNERKYIGRLERVPLIRFFYPIFWKVQPLSFHQPSFDLPYHLISNCSCLKNRPQREVKISYSSEKTWQLRMSVKFLISRTRPIGTILGFPSFTSRPNTTSKQNNSALSVCIWLEFTHKNVTNHVQTKRWETLINAL